jgi:glycerol uptake facilitator-like aquaporin
MQPSSRLTLTSQMQPPVNTVVSDEELKRQRGERRLNFYRAVYSEFLGTLLFFIPIFGAVANSVLENWDPTTTTLGCAMTTGFFAVPLIFCFSSLSGAQFNPAIAFALWLTCKQSSRKFIAFSIVQFIAPFFTLLVIWGTFTGVDQAVWSAIALHPVKNANSGRIFFSEFVMTFLLTFIAFVMAFEDVQTLAKSPSRLSFLPNPFGSHEVEEEEIEEVGEFGDETNTVIVYSTTPQSKTGFTPFAIGFFLLAAILFGGSSGVGMNPARYLAPAVFANEWKYFGEYIVGEYLGAGLAALLVVYGPHSSKNSQSKNPSTSVEMIRQSLSMRRSTLASHSRRAPAPMATEENV